MQQEYTLHNLYYKLKKARVNPVDAEAQKRFDAVCRFEQAMVNGLTAKDASRAVGVPCSTLYRWRKNKTLKLDSLKSASRRPKRLRKGKDQSPTRMRVVELRKEYPRWGKRKITRLLHREGAAVSESAVGRIISSLLKRGAIASAKASSKRTWKSKPKRPYAIKLKRGQRLSAKEPGDAVQIDHMSVHLSSAAIKHFNAVCTVSKWNVAEVYTSASAINASRFIDKVIKESPFPVKRIQVDGGSEFMADFEQACKKHNLELAVLAPKSPKLNGHVERINGTWRSDFYELYDLPDKLYELRPLLVDFTDTYNWDRPHDGLGLQTPQEFLESRGHKFRVSHSQMY